MNEIKKRSDEIRINILEKRKSKGRRAYEDRRTDVDKRKPVKYRKMDELME